MRRILSLLILVIPVISYGFIKDYVSKGCTPGVWTEDLSAARAYSKSNGLFYIIVFAKSGGCGFCKNAADSIWNTAEFKSWSRENDIPIVFADCSAMTHAADQFAALYVSGSIGVPVMAVVDGKDGTTKFGYSVIHGSSMMTGDVDDELVTGSEGYYFKPAMFNYKGIQDIVCYYLNKADDAVEETEIIGNAYKARARVIVPNAEKDKELDVIGMWGDWGKENDLSRTPFISGSTMVCVADDRKDWYRFKNTKANQSYILKTPYLNDKTDSDGIGYVGVYFKKSDAVNANKSYSKAKQYAGKNWFKLTDLKSGVTFTAPSSDANVYLLFTRRDEKKSSEKITLKYRFTLQKGALDAFYFGNKPCSFPEYDTTNNVAHTSATLGDWVTNSCEFVVYRTTKGTKTTASVKFADVDAVFGDDYITETGKETVTATFDAESYEAKVPFRIRSRKGLWKGNRSFTATITKSGKEGGSTVLTNVIKEVDAQIDAHEPDSASEAEEANLELPIGILINRLNAADTKDWFKLPEPSETNFLKVSVRELASSKSVALKYGIYDGKDYKTNNIDASTVFNVPPAWSNLYLKVSRSPTDDNISCVYQVKLEEALRPVVKFKDNTERIFDSPTADTNVTFELDVPYEWMFRPLPEIKAVDITATKEQDYAFTDVEITTNEVIVTLRNNDSAWRPERKFELELSPDKNGFYYIPEDESSITVTLNADPNDPPARIELTENSPMVPVEKELESYDNRNVSNTNTTDVLYFYVTNGVDYVLAASDVLVKPMTADQDIEVTVFTNLSSVSENVIHDETYNFLTNGYSLTSTTNVWFEFKDMQYAWVSNSVSEVTNYFDFTDSSSVTNYWLTYTNSVDGSGIPGASLVTNFWSEGSLITNCFTVTEITTNIMTRTQRKPEWQCETMGPYVVTNNYGAEPLLAPTNTFVAVTITNDCKWIEYDVWKLSDIANSDTMPLLRFIEPGDIKVEVTRDKDENVLAQYSLGLSQWVRTTVEFAQSAWTNMQNEAKTLSYTLNRSGDKQFESTVYVTLDCGTARDGTDVIAFKKKAVTFAAGESEAQIEASNLMYDSQKIWKGDRDFKLALEVKDEKLTLGAVSNATVVLKSHLKEYEDGDSDSEKSSAPAVTNAVTDAGCEFERTMNGRDNKDCFLFTDIKAGVRYRFRLEIDGGSTNHITGVETTFYTNEVFDAAAIATNLTDWAKILNKDFDFTPADGVTNITVRLIRKSTDSESASIRYRLTAREWPWPTFDFAKTEAEIKDSSSEEVVISVVRTNNDELTNEVDVVFTTLTNTAVSVYSPTNTQRLVFYPGQLSNNVIVTVNKGQSDVWTGDWAFKAELWPVKDDESRLGTNTVMTVAVKDADGEFDDRDILGDDSWRGVITNSSLHSVMTAYPHHLTNSLHGTDHTDWYCFTNVVSNALYYVAAEIVKPKKNVDNTKFSIKCYQSPVAMTNLPADISTLKLVGLALSNDMIRAETDFPMLVRVEYEAENSDSEPRSLRYRLSYRKVDAFVTLDKSEVAVDETSPGFYLNVTCHAGDSDDAELSIPVKVRVSPTALEGDTAEAPEDFDGREIEHVWESGMKGSDTWRVFIPLTNYDNRWEGNETFNVVLSIDEGAGLGETVSTKVTIVETDAPEYGTVAITGAGDSLKEITGSLVLSARENDKVQVRLTRKGGVTGDVVTRWYWKDEDNKTVKYASNGSAYTYHVVTNFFEGEDGSATCMIPIPAKVGYQKSQTWTLKMKMGTGCKTEIAEDSLTSIKFKVKDADYVGKISAYSADDPTKVAFSGSKWYTGPNVDTVRSMHPADGESVTMSATVTGPGWLVFDAELENVEKGYLKVTGGLADLKITASAVSNRVEIAPGNRKLKFSFKRSKYDPPTAAVAISNVSFEPSPTFNAYGTFTGPVDVDGAVGLATLTVASSGKASGKFSVGKIWSFSNKDGWNTNDWTMSATAKYGSMERPFIATNDLVSAIVTMTGVNVNVSAPVLMRNVWKDKPLPPEAADLIEAVVGEHTYIKDSLSIDFIVKSNGSVTISGTIDGKNVSFSRTLWMIDDELGVIWIDGDIYLELTVNETGVEISRLETAK